MSDTELDDPSDYGIRGIEKSQNYEPMVPANPVHRDDGLLDRESSVVKHLERPAPSAPIERSYESVGTGEPTPERQVVTAEQAAADLTNIRNDEAWARQKQHDADLNEALNHLQQEQAATAAPQPEQQPQEPPQPDYTPQLDPEHVQAMDPQYDPELLAALSSPKVRSLLEGVNQTIEATKSQYQEQVAHAGMTAVASFMAAFPELAELQADQLPGAIALINQTDPVRAQAIATHYNRVNGLVQQQQQVAAQQAQQQQELSAARFKEFAVVSDHRFDALNAHVPAETMRAIKTEAAAMMKEYGLSEADLAREYNSNPLLRSAAGQQVLMDAARWRLAQRSIPKAISRQIPHVVRPGSSAERVTRSEELLSEARAKLKPEMSAKEAAQYLIARRAAR